MERFFKHNGNGIYVFLSTTYYHLLISIILIEKYRLKNKSIIYVQNIAEDLLETCEAIKGIGIKIVSHVRSKYRLGYYFSAMRDKRFAKMIKRKNGGFHLVNFRWNIEHVFYDASTLYNECNDAIFFEDGPKSYINFTGSKKYKALKRRLGAKFDFYKDDKLKAIYVTEDSRYPAAFDDKIQKFNLSDCWKAISERAHENVLDLFVSADTLCTLRNVDGVGIIYTQPLSEDGYITEKEKKSIFQELCDYYAQYARVVLKIHPRDKTNYDDIGYQVLCSNWPSELLQLLGVHFKFAIGICTSAVSTSNAEIKMNLNDNYLKDKRYELIPLEIEKIS